MRHTWAIAILLMLIPLAAAAAGTELAFGGLQTDTSQPVKVTADQLSVNQNDGITVLKGNVVVTQGTMTLQAATVQIIYAADHKSIAKMTADGGVQMAAGTDAASSQTAEYMPDTGDLTMLGDVLMTQGASVMSGQSLKLSLKTGLGTMEGRVTTTYSPTPPPKKN